VRGVLRESDRMLRGASAKRTEPPSKALDVLLPRIKFQHRSRTGESVHDIVGF